MSADVLLQVGHADTLQVSHGSKATQVPSLHQVLRQRVLPVAAPAHSPGSEAVSLLLLREILPPALPLTAAHQVLLQPQLYLIFKSSCRQTCRVQIRMAMAWYYQNELGYFEIVRHLILCFLHSTESTQVIGRINVSIQAVKRPSRSSPICK